MCDQMVYPQTYEPCEMNCMPGEYENYDQQQEQSQECDYRTPKCNQCSPSQETQNFRQGYYDYNADSGLNMGGRDCTEYCDTQCYQNENNQQNEIYMPPCEPNMMQNRNEACRPCPEGCQLAMCSPFKKRHYIQPPRRQSFKPTTSYQRPSIPMACETIYRRSFENIDTTTAQCCRPPPFHPNGFLRLPGGNFEKATVTKMSYQPFCGVERRLPIKPKEHALLGSGPMQGLTTQKHDFVSKFQYPRPKFEPRDNISKSCGSVEKCTIQRMSFMPPCGMKRTKSFKPVINYKKSDMPMDFDTTQKLSYMPLCIGPKEDMPWAKKASYLPPSVPFATDTVTKLSFQPPGCFIDDEYCQEMCEPYCETTPRAEC